jgi:MtN3 and saliva related transmembrane protein
MSLLAESIGTAAATLTTLAYLPQALRTIRTRSTGDLSLKMLTLLASGLVLWALYGVYRSSLPIIIANIVTLALIAPILYHKLVSVARPREDGESRP